MSSAPNNAAAHRPSGERSRAWSSLSAQLALWYIAVTLASFGAAAAMVAFRTRAFLDSEQDRSAQGTLEQFRQALENGGTGALQSMFDCAPRPGLALRLTDERDVELFVVASDAASRSAAQESEHEDALGASPQWRVASTQVSQRRHLSIAMHDERGEALWHELRTTSLLILLGGLAVAIAGATLITRRTLRPVTDLAAATQKILESGDLGLRVQTRATADELSRLGQLFNRMLGKNQALVRAMHESLDYVAHDLRTPLTRLRAGAELALQGEPDAGKEREALAEVVEESDRVLSMLTTLTDVIEAEAGA
ncbi:MAG TPA: histidine kinase dimerization/phospho-acceptor domain-containing protein, partial [Polyangiaceae bacterium]